MNYPPEVDQRNGHWTVRLLQIQSQIEPKYAKEWLQGNLLFQNTKLLEYQLLGAAMQYALQKLLMTFKVCDMIFITGSQNSNDLNHFETHWIYFQRQQVCSQEHESYRCCNARCPTKIAKWLSKFVIWYSSQVHIMKMI